MYNVVKQEAPDRWVKELLLPYGIQGLPVARTKSKLLMCTYMAWVDATTNRSDLDRSSRSPHHRIGGELNRSSALPRVAHQHTQLHKFQGQLKDKPLRPIPATES